MHNNILNKEKEIEENGIKSYYIDILNEWLIIEHLN